MRSHVNRSSGARRAAVAVAAVLALVAWLATVVTWTASARVTSADGFSDVAVETIQSPPGSQAVTDALVERVDAFASARGFDLTSVGRGQVAGQVQQVVEDPGFPGLMAPALERARDAYAAAPGGPITIDFSALRPLAEERVSRVDPALVAAIPPADELVVTVQGEDLPAAAADIAGAQSTLRWLPLWLLIAAVALAALAVGLSGNRPGVLRRLGLASIVVAIVPLGMRLGVPPAVASFLEAGTPADVGSTAAGAILAHWWIAMVACLALGIALIGLSVYADRAPRQRRPPVVLGR